MDCRCKDARRKLISHYEFCPIAHVKLLAGQSKTSCAKDQLTDTYYCFSYESRIGAGEASGTFFCGKFVAKDFLFLTCKPPLPLFNPLLIRGGGQIINSVDVVHNLRANWNPAKKQLHNAINLLIVCWATPPKAALARIKIEVEKFPTSAPLTSQIKAINTIHQSDHRKRTLTRMVSELARDNPMKEYDFSLLDDVLAANGVTSSFS